MSRPHLERGESWINWAAVIPSTDPGKGYRTEDWNRAARLDDFLPLFEDWKFDWLDVPAIIRGAPQVYEFPFVDRDPLPRWSFGRVTLLGDAAHPMHPWGSSGATLAFVDAYVLADALSRNAELEKAFEQYEAVQRSISTKVDQRQPQAAGPVDFMAIVEERAPQGYDHIDAVISAEGAARAGDALQVGRGVRPEYRQQARGNQAPRRRAGLTQKRKGGAMIRRRTMLRALLSLGCAALVGAAHAQQGGGELKLGFLMPLTGGPGKMGNMMLEGAQLAVEEINAAGGIAGRKLALIPEDSQGLAKPGLDGFRKLVDIDRVDVIITGYTAVVVAVAPQAEQSKSFLLSGSTASSAVRAVSPYFQNVWPYEEDQVNLMLGYAKNTLKAQRLAVMTVISDLGSSLGASVKKEWAALGGTLAADETHQQGEMNFRSTMLKMLTTRPDAIYLTTSNDKQAAQIVRQARELGYKGAFLSFGALEGAEILAIGKHADGCYFSSAAYDPNGDNPLTRRFVEQHRKRFGGATPNIHHANHYDLVHMYKQAAEALIKQGKPVNGASMRESFMQNVATYRGAGGAYRFNFKDGSARRSVIVKGIADGKFVKIADLE